MSERHLSRREMLEELTLLPQPPDKQQVETEVSNLLKDGDQVFIARLIERDPTLVSKLLSANCADKNNVVSFYLQFQWAMDCRRRALGSGVAGIVARERAKWLEHFPSA